MTNLQKTFNKKRREEISNFRKEVLRIADKAKKNGLKRDYENALKEIVFLTNKEFKYKLIKGKLL